MLRKPAFLVFLFAILWSVPAWSQAKVAKFKSIEPRHFARNEGVELSPDFPEFLYALLKEELERTKVFEEILGENEAVDSADVPRSLILDGTLVEYKKGNLAAAVIIGFGAGSRSLVVRYTVKRRGDNSVLLEKEAKVRSPRQWDEKMLAKNMAHKIAGEVKNAVGK